ncbi:MAG: type II secretion system protein GspM [Gammaproteobacteria bacterium]|nr:type II secretion system protein GspM [Gammaproteobacteria bacterium]MDH5652912.1 type II secretion system protein GspM [Gammaproteobacteria bacterium]
MEKIERYSKPVAIGILLLVIMFVWLIVVLPYHSSIMEKYRDIERLQRKLSTLQNLEQSKDKIAGQYRSIMNNRSLDAIYINKGNGVIAGARLQGMVRRLVEKHGSVLTQSSIKKESEEKTGSITLHVAMTGSVESTYKIFHEIENSMPVMIVANVNLSGTQAAYRHSASKNMLTASFEVTAYVK